MKSNQQLGGDALQQLAARLSNTGQVLSAWSDALGDQHTQLARRLERGATEIRQAVRSLTMEDDVFEALEELSAMHESTPPPLRRQPQRDA